MTPEAERKAFLATTPWRDAEIVPIPADASVREYARLVGGPSAAMLMDAEAAAKTPPCPPDADEEERKRLGYPAMVRSSGSALLAFEAASKVLAERGVIVPEVCVSDHGRGLAVIEDLGARMMRDAIEHRPDTELSFYKEAAAVLEKLRGNPVEPGERHAWPFQTYDRLAYRAEAALLEEWYLPRVLGLRLPNEDVARLGEAWDDVLSGLSKADRLVHRDFHAENLLLTDRGIAVIDFQDMMVGQAAYDWASLLEDARRDVSPEVRDAVYALGVQGAEDPEAFERDYAILAAQRNAKILGIFARLIHRDGKPKYERFIPRVAALLKADLAREPLRPVAEVLRVVAPEIVE
ncbi:aminoglycoside phosphotransferase family protein [Parvularcula lutaonensis]|uniref:Aminoglycoside phosphotransferase family protein n=1 Tax=Parvularcula lutaonensis TaxID=491923 RepID=A0ABV7MAI7_9PROT|nr:phosphotransferase [Parvularcula lutaonensis]GGY37311.1 aminoglycoside phosphotransferase [Parvularcula lutaonensis]